MKQELFERHEHLFTSRIATVCFLGRNNAYGQNAYRLTQIERIIEELGKRKSIYKNLSRSLPSSSLVHRD